MDSSFFLGLGAFLVILLALLIVLLFLRSKKKNTNQNFSALVKEEPKKDLNALMLKLQDSATSSKELQSTLDLVLNDYGTINDFSLYQKILLSITIHPRTNKNIILGFDKKLSKLNPSYKKEISKAVTDALNSRGA